MLRRPRLDPFEEMIRATVARSSMLDGVERVVLAVSGGPDSMALLHAFARLRAAVDGWPEPIVDGLAGIASVRELDGSGFLLIRPTLGATRADVLRYCDAREIDFRVDATNADTDRSRAFARHELLPRLERIAPGAAANVARLAM